MLAFTATTRIMAETMLRRLQGTCARTFSTEQPTSSGRCPPVRSRACVANFSRVRGYDFRRSIVACVYARPRGIFRLLMAAPNRVGNCRDDSGRSEEHTSEL